MEVVFDFIIYFYLGVVGMYGIHALHNWQRVRRSPVALGSFCILMLSWGVMFYGSFIEPRMLVVKQEEMVLSQQSTQTLRMVVLSDIHAGPFKKQDWVQRVVDNAMNLEPDIIVILGDFVVQSADDAQYLTPLSGLAAPYGVYAVTGNHEYHAQAVWEVLKTLRTAGIDVIENEIRSIDVNGKTLHLAGVSDIWFDGDLKKTLTDVQPEQNVILLAHNPDAVLDPETQNVDAVFAAHTHGGQIRLPWIGPIARIPTQLGQSYDKGWFTYNGINLFITSGVGESGTRARLFNPPELVQMNVQF